MPQQAPPNDLPYYRVLCAAGQEEFSRLVSEALVLGYRLHHGPSVTHDGKQPVFAQAVVWPGAPVPAEGQPRRS